MKHTSHLNAIGHGGEVRKPNKCDTYVGMVVVVLVMVVVVAVAFLLRWLVGRIGGWMPEGVGR